MTNDTTRSVEHKTAPRDLFSHVDEGRLRRINLQDIRQMENRHLITFARVSWDVKLAGWKVILFDGTSLWLLSNIHNNNMTRTWRSLDKLLATLYKVLPKLERIEVIGSDRDWSDP